MRGSRREGEGSGTQAVKPQRGEGCRARPPPAHPAEVRLGQRFAQVRKGAASGSPQRALLGPVSSAASAPPAPFNGLPSRGLPSAGSPLTGSPQPSLSQRAHLNGRRRRAATGLRAGGSGGGGRSPRPGGRGHGRGGGPGGPRRERARGHPSPLAAACGQRRGGDSEAGPVTGAGPGEAGDAPRAPPPPPRGLPRPRPSGRRRLLLLLLRRPRDQRHRSPPPSRQGPARRAPRYLGQTGARPGLREPEECMTGGRRRRRPRRRGLPAPGPGGRRGDSVPRARRLCAPGLAGRGGGRRKRRRPRAPSNEGAARRPARSLHRPPSPPCGAPRDARPRPGARRAPESDRTPPARKVREGPALPPSSAPAPLDPPFSPTGRAALLSLLRCPGWHALSFSFLKKPACSQGFSSEPPSPRYYGLAF